MQREHCQTSRQTSEVLHEVRRRAGGEDVEAPRVLAHDGLVALGRGRRVEALVRAIRDSFDQGRLAERRFDAVVDRKVDGPRRQVA